jgi:hypothetical protein
MRVFCAPSLISFPMPSSMPSPISFPTNLRSIHDSLSATITLRDVILLWGASVVILCIAICLFRRRSNQCIPSVFIVPMTTARTAARTLDSLHVDSDASDASGVRRRHVLTAQQEYAHSGQAYRQLYAKNIHSPMSIASASGEDSFAFTVDANGHVRPCEVGPIKKER